jgi:hypothetical protein
MSVTNREKKKIAKKIARRKSYVAHRNRRSKKELVQNSLSKMKGVVEAKKNGKTEAIDGTKFYEQLKAQENKGKEKKASLFQRIGKVFTKGNK